MYEFVDGDDRKSFLRERPAHVLYLWHLAYKYDILHTVRQQLRSGSSIDGDAGPSVDTARSIKRKHSPDSNDPSLITNGLSNNIQQIAESINGLVGVARLSHETQQMNMLHLRRKQLEDFITKLDESCMDLEMKCIDSSGSRKKLFQKVLKKKQTEMEEKKKELNDTMLEITTKTTTMTPNKLQPMPEYVNLANSADEEDTSTNDDSVC